MAQNTARPAATVDAVVAWIHADWGLGSPDRTAELGQLPAPEQRRFAEGVRDLAMRLLDFAIAGDATQFLVECGRTHLDTGRGTAILARDTALSREDRKAVQSTLKRVGELWGDMGAVALQRASTGGDLRALALAMLSAMGASINNPDEIFATAQSPDNDAEMTISLLGIIERFKHLQSSERLRVRQTREELQRRRAAVMAARVRPPLGTLPVHLQQQAAHANHILGAIPPAAQVQFADAWIELIGELGYDSSVEGSAGTSRAVRGPAYVHFLSWWWTSAGGAQGRSPSDFLKQEGHTAVADAFSRDR